jgi:hypothetical protein
MISMAPSIEPAPPSGGEPVDLTPPYIHALDGRLRIKLATVKGSPTTAVEIEGRLRCYPGIIHVSANPITGNVLILYDHQKLAQHEVLETLRTLGYLRQLAAANGNAGGAYPSQSLGKILADTLARTTMELAVQGLIRALV